VKPAIETRNLSFAYGERQVLGAISCSIESGEMVGILGPNGSGKTTMLKILSGILRGEGEVCLSGRTISDYSRRELSKICGTVAQESRADFPYTAAEIVLMGRASHHSAIALEGKEDLRVARASMELTGVADLANRYLHELSGGEKQRVLIARALAQEPQLLLLDEPSAFLDLKHQLQVFQLLQRLNRERALTIVAALHDLNLAALFFPRLIVLRNGTIFGDGPPERVLTEQTIQEVYGIRVRVEQDAATAIPRVLICPEINDSPFGSRERPAR
jgi:iron complex transport system ATP-binding protein